MEHKKISVVIPVYNSVKHIQTAFDSLFCQTMPKAEFEVICVNDCSTDNSREIIEKWAEKLPNIKLINLPENTGGPMIPRNTGIEAASGKYVHFLDNDDFLGEESLQRLYTAAEKYHSDVIFGRHRGINGRRVPRDMFGKGNLPNADFLTDRLVYSLAPHKLFRTSFLQTHGIRFHPRAKAGNEDQLFVMQCFIQAKVITVLDDYNYYFVVARGAENLSSRVFPAHEYLFVPHEIMKYTDEHVQDAVLNRRIKSAYINRFLSKSSLRDFLLDAAFPAQKKQEYLAEGKKFLKSHMDQEMMRTVDPVNLELMQALLANDLQAVDNLSKQKMQADLVRKEKAVLIFVTARRAAVQTYWRPSVNALLTNHLLQRGRPFQVFAWIDDWLEVRLSNENGDKYAVFVKQEEVQFPLASRVQKLVRRIKSRFLPKVLLRKMRRR